MQLNPTNPHRHSIDEPVLNGSPKKPNLVQQNTENQYQTAPSKKRNWSSHCIGSVLSRTADVAKLVTLSGTYQGEVDESRKPKGQGRFVTVNGETYEGVFDGGKFIQGHYKNTLTNTEYEGSFQNNKFQGFGKLTVHGVYEYEGFFHENNFKGKGNLSFVSGLKIDSVFESCHQINGPSIITLPNRNKIAGNIVAVIHINISSISYQNIFKGTIYYKNGDIYKGPILDEKASGEGQLYSKNGNWWHKVWYDDGELKAMWHVLRDI